MADRLISASVSDRGGSNFVTKKFVEIDTDVYAEGVTIVGLDTPVEITGDLVVDTFGALDNAKVVNPDAASATIPALLRGILKQQVDILAAVSSLVTALGAAGDAAGDATAIGQLKQIAENTTP